MKSAIFAAVAGGLLLAAQGAIANVMTTTFPPSGDEIVSIGFERARDSRSVLPMVPPSSEDLAGAPLREVPARTIVLGEYPGTSVVPPSYGD
jgi:hypothetical protein